MTRPKQIKFRVDLFAYTLVTISFGWAVMSLLRGWAYDLWLQAGIVMLSSLIWALYSNLALHYFKGVELRRLRAEAAEKSETS
jgi:hypothetical protein